MPRPLDITLALVTAIGLLPLFGILAALQWHRLGRPIFFRQKRAGLHGRPFTLVKFRTMRQGVGDDGDRLTPWGRFLRSTSLDEIPELWNVIRGDMSLVGPRPLPVHYLPRYSARQARRHEVRPGITGWAQVNGRNTLSWERQFELDVWYVEHRSFLLDLRILGLTVATLFRRGETSAPGQATRTEFFGSGSPGKRPNNPD